jgi:hypothetical protein
MSLSAGLAARRHPGLDYIECLEEAFEVAAEQAGGASERGLEIGGCAIRFRFSTEALSDALTAALSHHPACDADSADFTICAFDASAAGIRLPTFPWGPADVRERGEVRGFNDDRVRTLYEIDAGMLSMLDVEGGRTFLAVDDLRRMPSWHRAAPMRVIFHWILGSPTMLLAHAAAVGDGAGGVLLAGAGGSGKSTTAVACAAAGLRYAGDDYVLLETAGRPVVHSLYTSAKLTATSLAILSPLGPTLLPGSIEDEKRVINMARAFPHGIARSLPVQAIVLPQVTRGEPARLVRASAAQALRALAPTTIYQLPSNGGRALGQFAELVRRVPAYTLAIGDDMSIVCDVISELIGGVRVEVHR